MLSFEKRFLRPGPVFRRHWSAMESFVQFVAEPRQLTLASVFRAVVAIHHRFSGDSSVALYFFSVLMLTAVIWQCYIANVLASVKVFLSSWALLKPRQRLVSPLLGVAILCAPLFVANGLLELAHGLPPSVPMRVFNFLPAVLWTIPVVLNSALGLFRAANGALLKQMQLMQEMQEVVTVHLFTMAMYCVFVANSKADDAVIGSSWTAVLGMLGATFVGFVVQFMYRGPPRPHRRVIDHIEQDYFEEPQPTCIPESEAQSVSYSEIVLSPIATQQFSAGHELVLPTSNLPKLPDNAERVVQTDTFVSSRHVPNDVHRPEASRSQRCIPVVTSYNDNVLATSSN